MRLVWGLVFAALPTALLAGPQSDALRRAIEKFDARDFLTAQQMLLSIDRSRLDAQEQGVRDEYLNRVQVALTMHEKALRDLEDAETALEADEPDQAVRLLNAVVENQYAANELVQAARAYLRDLAQRDQTSQPDQQEVREVQPQPPGDVPPEAPPGDETPAEEDGRPEETEQAVQEPEVDEDEARTAPAGEASAPPTGPALERARILTREAGEMLRAGRHAEATRLYREVLQGVPGYPEAVEGLARLQEHAEIASGTVGRSLIDRLRRQDAINWQRVETQVRDLERTIRDLVGKNRYEEAHRLLVRAGQVLESGRQYADPIAAYERLSAQMQALTVWVREKERAFHESEVARVQAEIIEQRTESLRRIEENRARQVEALMEEAAQYRKDGDLETAVQVYKQVIAIDPKYKPARWLLDEVADKAMYRKQRDARHELNRQMREVMLDVEEAKIPWHHELQYPKDWLERINRPERRKPGRIGRDHDLWGALDRPVPIDLRGEPFQQVIERFADAHRLNIIVNWSDLHRAGIKRDAPIDLRLPREISLRKALTEILAQAGGASADLGFDASDGVITIATQEFIDHKTYPVVYDINDLLLSIPEYDDAPKSDLRNATRKASEATQSVDTPWRHGDDDDDEPERDPVRQSRVQQIIELIQETVAPESWRERGGTIGSIREINGQLVVTQNTAAQTQISDLLSKLREERAVQVAVEAVFLTVTSHFLEELGLNINVLLNAGNAGFDFVPGADQPLVDPVLGNRLLLPRTFSRIGVSPNSPAVGTGLGQDPNLAPTPQPFGRPFLIPQQQGGGGSQTTPVPVISNILDFTNPVNLPSDIPGSFGGQDIGPALSIFGSFLDNIQVDFLLRATQADSRSSVLTAPRVVVFNGFGAWVAVTIQQNFVSTLNPVIAQGAVAQQPVIGTVDAGAVLNIVQAVVTADKRYVMMTLSPGVTRLIDLQSFPFSGGTGALNAFVQLPTLSSLRVQTAVSVPDGGTLLIGGQKLSSESDVEAGVPILSKIPILKRAYSARTNVKDEQTLLILIKPKILIQTEQEELAFPSFTDRAS